MKAKTLLVLFAFALATSCIYHGVYYREITWNDVPGEVKDSYIMHHTESEATKVELATFRSNVVSYTFTLQGGSEVVIRADGEYLGVPEK